MGGFWIYVSLAAALGCVGLMLIPFDKYWGRLCISSALMISSIAGTALAALYAVYAPAHEISSMSAFGITAVALLPTSGLVWWWGICLRKVVKRHAWLRTHPAKPRKALVAETPQRKRLQIYH